jgi:peptidoglycan/LPS O-acetylase OafA/YrhL
MQVAEPVALVSPSTSPVPSHAAFLSCKYFSSLDVFRFLAIMAVLWHHTSEGFARLPASERGYLGVDFFFEISGFLIVTLLLRERDRTGRIAFRQFYVRRSLRIFPIYYGMLGAMTAFFLFVRPHATMAGPFFRELPYQALYLSDFWDAKTILFFTWSLSAEEQFYVFWPPVEKWLRGFTIPILLAVIAVNQLINFGLMGPTFGEYAREHSILQITFTPICLGVLLAHLLHDRRWFDRIASFFGRPWSSIVLGASVALACNVPNPDLAGWPRLMIQVLMILLMASCVICEDNWLNRMLGFRWVRRIGVISYGMYLYHEFVVHVVRLILGSEKTAPPFSFFLVTSALTILVAELSFRFYETPFLKLKDRLHASAARKKAAAGSSQ